ncbi:hypothetical protein C0Q70_10932 [Pomacea canaliculata]|uniref:Cadherin domain-containing protein n=1 Tax=Pomacea canaliculata TaxID=400727 RepID=A0A2T7P4J0_POMCA|nr:hypothetical protein C0Q70_10932 [Pomacea canaliculata]
MKAIQIPEKIQHGETLLTVLTKDDIMIDMMELDDNELLIILEVNYTDDHSPVLLTNLSFSLAEGGNTDEAFGITSLGVIFVKRLIFYQKGETKFELVVSVTTSHDFDPTGREASETVVVNIIDVDDNDPVFTVPVYRLHVQEENTTVLNVPQLTSPRVFAFDQDTGINDSVTYSINGSSSTVGIDSDTGLVRVMRILDREEETVVEVEMKANQMNNSWRSATATILVMVDDINDNRPKFQPGNPTLVRIPEHSAFGSYVVRVLALDKDAEENALFNYTLRPEESVFAIQTDILVSPPYGTVTVANSSALDREIISSLNLTVYTEEFTLPQGGDCSTGMCNITITIQLTDINDNSPVFDNSSYRLTVRDNTMGVSLMAVNASDADEGENADLRYSCVPSYALGSDGCSVITVEDKTGEISLSQPLDSLQVYYASIEACDSPTDVSQIRCTTVPVIISLHPDLQLNVTSYNFTVYENLPAGTYVGDILVRVIDITLRAKDFLDREEQEWYTFVINTHNEENTNISVLVTVLDVNDNSPAFDNSSYRLTVMNNNVGNFVGTINASDADEGENADLRYRCVSSVASDDACGVMTVNDTTGEVVLQRSLISSHKYYALVEACDSQTHSTQRRCTTVLVILSLHPDLELNVTSYNFTVYENLPAGTYVGDLLNNDHNFELQDDTFELHERTLRTKELLDREKQDHYLFVINTNNQNNTNITVQVTVLDVNDNSPVFNNSNYKLFVVNNTKDELLETIRASDDDEGENADLSYKCVSVADTDGCGEITVHNETGDIRLRRPLTKSQMYFALVEACDNPVDDLQSRCTSVPIRISLPPDFDLNMTSYNFTVHENLPAGTYVGDLLDYEGHFELHHDKFQLDERTIRTKGSLDREKEDQFLFVINTNNQNNTNISVLVTVLDVNDNSPVFDRSNYRLTVVDNTRDALVHKVNASDDDEDENARLQYRCMPSYVSSSNGCSVFTVNNATGEIRLQQELTSLEMYFVIVEACDTPTDTSQSRCTTVPVRISLPPDFDLNVTSYNFTVHENLPAGTYVGDILNNDHNFELQDDTFELHERTLRTKELLDREKQDHYLFVINTNSQNNTNITVQVTVLDVNDNSPVFNNTNYKLTVVNNTKDELLETIRASDPDEGKNADLSYKCVSVADMDGCGEITVNNETGEIRLRQPLTKLQMSLALVEGVVLSGDIPIRISLPPDFDLNVTSYNFTVHENLPAGTYVGDLLDYDGHFELHHDKFQLDERTIRTKGSLDREKEDQFLFVINTNNQNSTNISVLVTVLDVNDNSPVFDNSNYRLTVVDNTRDALVHKVNASDSDEGENARLQYRCMPSYVSSSNGCSVFTVNNATGEIRLQQQLTSSEMYLVLVEACDTPNDTSQSRCTTVPVRISLPPNFDLNVTSYNFTVHENLPAGTYVGDILYYDPHFELQHNMFELNGRNLQTLKSLDREMQDQYMFVINTNDQNNTNISVLVTVLDVNDNSPVFNNSHYRLTVVDNKENTFLEMINASDADEGENAVLRYRCVSSVTSNDACGVMTVNGTTGETRLLQPLVSSQTYYALVEACDSPTDISQSRCTTVTVRISLPPDFDLNVTSYNFTVHENLPAGTYVGEILNYDDLFVLQHDNFELHKGTLRTKKPLDREDQDHHNLIVNTNNQNNTNISVLVIVLDVNDNNPIFNPNNGSVTLSGEETTGHVITVVNTMDLLVKASDGGSPSLSGFYTLRITIPAVNGSVVIFAPVTNDKLEKNRIERELIRILGVNVTVETIRQHSVDSSAVYITARGMSTGQPLKVEELQKLVDSKPAEIADLFRQNVPDGTNERAIAADDFTTPVIVLIVIAAVLLIALIIATVFIARAHKSRKRNKRMFKSLSTPATFYDTAKTDAEKSDESIGTINPAFVDDDESQSVTLVNETEVTSVADMQSFHEAGDNDDDVSENEGTGRPPDADSGVPSDRENGHGDDDDIDNSSDDGGSSPQSPHSSRYLEAVLDEPLLNSADPEHDAVDVTSPGMYSEALEALLLPVDSLDSGPPAEPPVDFDVQDNYPTFAEEEFPKEITEAALPIAEAEVGSDLDPVTPEDEVEDTGSLNGFLGFRLPTRSFTPPMVRKSQEQREEELEPMPEEPMPDYGKKVRFNFQVTEHEITDYNDNDEDLDEDDNDTENPADNEEFPMPPPPLPPPPPPTLSTDHNLINESSDDSRRGDEHDPNTNEEEEITSF